MSVVYLAALLIVIGCMLLLDHRFRLFFWRDWRSATVVTVVGTVFFLVWDIVGIGFGVFLRGLGPIATGILLAPELPLEEPVFLVFLVLCTMIVYTGSARIIAALAGRHEERR